MVITKKSPLIWSTSKISLVRKCSHKYLQFHGHHSYFRKDFQMIIVGKVGHVQLQHHALGQI